MPAARALEWLSDSPPADPAARLRAFRRLLLIHFAAETTIALLRWRGTPSMSPVLPMLVTVSVSALVLSFVPRARRWSAPLAVAGLLSSIVLFLPSAANHTFFLLVCLLPFVLWRLDDPEERVLALGTLRWTAALVLFATGLQKLLHGTYFHGEFLAFQIAHGQRFASAFQFLVPVEELARLKAIGAAAGAHAAPGFQAYVTAPPAVGSGPYRLEAPLALAAVNVVWAFELVAPFLLLWSRTRAVTATIVVLFLFTIEVGALELMFGALFTGSMLLFFRRDVIVWLLPAYAAAYAYLIGVHLGVVPQWFFFN